MRERERERERESDERRNSDLKMRNVKLIIRPITYKCSEMAMSRGCSHMPPNIITFIYTIEE